MKILVADKLPNSATELLRDEGWSVDSRSGRPLSTLKADIADVDGLIVRSATIVDADLIDAAHNLRVIARAGTGVDNIDLDKASARGILVMNSPGATSISVAEHSCALMLSLARSISLADAQMKDGKWEKKSLQGAELRGKTLGIVGLGRIGRGGCPAGGGNTAALPIQPAAGCAGQRLGPRRSRQPLCRGNQAIQAG